MMAVSKPVLKTALFEALIVFAGIVFVRKEVYLQAEFHKLLLQWQDISLCVVAFIYGIASGACPGQIVPGYVSSQHKHYQSFFGLLLFLYVSCAALCKKLGIGVFKMPGWCFLGLAMVCLCLVLSVWISWATPEWLYEADKQSQEAPEQSRIFTRPEGLWCWLRYPQYLVFLLMLAGYALLQAAWLPLLSLPGIFVALKWMTIRQEVLRIRQLGKFYMEYKQHSWSIIPYIY